jgi:hypothetical protein
MPPTFTPAFSANSLAAMRAFLAASRNISGLISLSFVKR